MSEMTFEWDEKKNKLNQKLHGIAFEDAKFVFNDPFKVILPDLYHSEKEERWLAIGVVSSVLFVVSPNAMKIPSELYRQEQEQKPKRGYIMIITTKLKPEDKPTRDQIKRIKLAAKTPIVHDKDSPVYTSEQLAHLYSKSKRLNKKQTVGIRLNPKTIEQYKDIGKGYTGIMAAVLDYAIRHPEVLKKAL